MIDPMKDGGGVANWFNWIGWHVFYQQRHMRAPEYGRITGVQSLPVYLHVTFNGEATAKACRPEDLHWPPNYCAIDGGNPPGQPFALSVPPIGKVTLAQGLANWGYTDSFIKDRMEK